MSLKVVCVVDKVGTALDRLAKGVAKYHDNLNYVVLDVHPKRPDPEQLLRFEQEAEDADIIDWQYFRTAETLRKMYPWLSEKKQILTHNNPYSIEESDWKDYDLNVGNNLAITKRLKEITDNVEHVPLTVDTDFWTYNLDWEPTNTVIMVANRIEGKKGILPVAIAATELGMKFILVGAISDRDYFQAVMATGNVEYHEQISDEELRSLYYRSTIHVCNSIDNFESGTLPVLEAMLCGVPVMSRNVGHVPELYNGENMVLYEGDNEDVKAIHDLLKDMLFDKKKLKEMRDKAWNTAKTRSFERRAYMYQKLYRQVLYESPTVSVIVPIYNRPEIIRKCLDAVAEQTYKNIELIIVDDKEFYEAENGVYMPKLSENINQSLIMDFAKYVDFPVRYIQTAEGDYGLARARNEGIIEATGEILVFCDQRMIMEQNAVEMFVYHMKPKTWLYGNKGLRKEFVENFSAVYRQDIVNAGMFNERINLYGGMSQEIRSRIRAQGFQVQFVEGAKCTPTGKSSNRNRKRAEIIKMKNRLFKMNLQ